MGREDFLFVLGKKDLKTAVRGLTDKRLAALDAYTEHYTGSASIAASLLIHKFYHTFWGKKDDKPQKTHITPSPLVVKKEKEPATKEDLEEVKEEIEKIKQRMEKNREVSRDSLSRIHTRLDSLAKQTDQMEGHLKGQLTTMQGVMNQLLELHLKK
eukprot:Seg13155.2 transcript_id=Seg13155.2/GoldUCD/mRNA.D3Y31 product="hypothetical protein" protein_id=Seg13155.2/GoldUCD/D3Y31